MLWKLPSTLLRALFSVKALLRYIEGQPIVGIGFIKEFPWC